jgi:hypothetical protein
MISLLINFSKKVFVLSAVLVINLSAQGDEKFPRVIAVSELNSRKIEIIGRLGLPLATVAEVEATIIDGGSVHKRFDLRWDFLLSVDRINGKTLSTPELFSFRVLALGGRIVAQYNDLPKLNRQTPSQKKPTEEELEEIKRRYVGTRFKLALFEVGSVGTFPRNLTEDLPIWSNWEDYFQTSVVVLAVR